MKAVRPGMLIGTELHPTPRGGDGAPLRVRPAWWRELRERPDPVAARRTWGAYAGPITGGARTVDGVDLVEVTFLARAAPGRSIMLHLNTLTDRHRADMRPALMERAGGTRLLGLTVLLAADGVLGYRLADVTGLPRDVGDPVGLEGRPRAGAARPRQSRAHAHAPGRGRLRLAGAPRPMGPVAGRPRARVDRGRDGRRAARAGPARR